MGEYVILFLISFFSAVSTANLKKKESVTPMYSPKQAAQRLADGGVGKAHLPTGKALVLGVLAGACIALAGFAAAAASAGTPIQKLINACIFPAGLIMTVLMGAELFTGNCMMVMPLLQRRISFGKMLRNWVLVYIGNFVGAIAVAAIACFSGLAAAGTVSGDALTATAATKCALSFGQAFLRGIGCNVLVCAAVVMAAGADTAGGKAACLFFPVMAFVAAGFEHSVANMFYIPAGLFAAAGTQPALTWGRFLLGNLVPVTLGNIVGGGLLGLIFWVSHLREAEK